MAALSDPKLEKFSQALLVNIAQGMPRSRAASEAARAAGYTGKSVAANARKRATLPQVKARMAELAAPAREVAEKAVAITVGAAEDKLWGIASVNLGKDAVKVPDQIAAIKTLAQFRGWNAPEKTELTTPIKIERIDRIIVDHPKPKTPDKP
jgi:hypothetical protein